MKYLIFGLTTVLSLLSGNLLADDLSPEQQALQPEKHLSVFKKYCFECHDAETEEGKLNLESLSFVISKDVETAETWAKILNAINSGEMPPESSQPISDAEKLSFLDDLSKQLVVARKILSDTGGLITMRRLNRREYQNTIEALLGVRPDVSSLPDDQAASAGFDTAGASLFFSSDQLEQYLSVARETLKLALIPQPARKARTDRIEPEKQYTPLYLELLAEKRDTIKRAKAFLSQSQRPASEFGFLDAGQAKKQLRSAPQPIPLLDDYLKHPETKRGVMLISMIKPGITKISTRIIDGGPGKTLLLRVRAAAYPGVDPRFHYLEFSMRSWSGGYAKPLGWRKVTGTLETPQTIEFSVTAPAGERVQFYVHQRTHQGRGDKNLVTLNRETNPLGTVPGLWIDWMEVVYPEQDGKPSAVATKRLPPPVDGQSVEHHAKAVIEDFATIAFRTKQPSPDYVEKLFAHYQAERSAGRDHREALIEPLAIVLSSPSFLYMVESTGGTEALTDLELAVRLSYFLWSAPPDLELANVARSGMLSVPHVLRQQTTRLLNDQRADRFVRSFVHQWMGMERLGMFQFEARLYPTFDNAARESAREEVFQTVHRMLDERLPLNTLLKSDFVVVNDLLADYYGISSVDGHWFRKVPLTDDLPRGGLLGSAAVLAMGSDGIRTSPVERGAWVLRHLLNDPPPPAPANVPQISRLEGEVFSARKIQQVHQEQPQCAQCHRKIDPIGFGLENFDAAGQWRDVEVVRFGKRMKNQREFPIDPSGQLIGGAKFADYHSLRDVVAKRVDDFARGMTEALIEYGLGRPYGFTDQRLADEIINRAKTEDYELSVFVHALIQSREFQSK